MQLHTDPPGLIRIHAVGPDWIDVGGARHTSALLLASSGVVIPWQANTFEALSAQHFSALTALMSDHVPELALFGSGARQRFPRPEWLGELFAKGIGVETMTSRKACHTFNILVSEGRRVVAALLPLGA